MKETELPSQIELVGHIAKLFGNRKCVPRQVNAIIEAANSILKEMRTPFKPAVADMGYHSWLATDDCGLSSRWMAEHVMGYPHGGKVEYPRDADDFHRCVKMLAAIREVREGLMSPGIQWPKPWDALMANWEGLCKLCCEERFNELSSEIQKLIK